MKPLISVVIPTYNRKSFIKKAIDSVLNQTFKDFELIVIDDGSTDSTIEIMSDYLGCGINYFSTNHFGVSHARNVGIKNSLGEYIAFLDSDDRWTNEKLMITNSYIKSDPMIKIFHTDEVWYKKGKMLKQQKKHRRPTGYVYPNCLPLCCIGMSTTVVRRDLFEEIGLFDEELYACEDYDLWLRACSKYEVMLIPQPLTLKEGGRGDQLSSQPGLDKYRVRALEKILSKGDLNDEQRSITYNEFVHKSKIYSEGARKRGRLKEASLYLDKIKQYRI